MVGSKNHKNNLGSRSPLNFVYFCHSLVIVLSFCIHSRFMYKLKAIFYKI